jgi:hypothetical protein
MEIRNTPGAMTRVIVKSAPSTIAAEGGDWLNDEADYEAPTRLLAGGRLNLDRVRS